jgi:hypothetical protein
VTTAPASPNLLRIADQALTVGLETIQMGAGLPALEEQASI